MVPLCDPKNLKYSVIIGVFSLLQVLAFGLLVKTWQTGPGMFAKGMRLRFGGIPRQMFGLWPSMCASVEDIVAFIRSGVSERGSIAVKLLSPLLVSLVSSGLMNSWPAIGLKLPFLYLVLRREPQTMQCSFDGAIISRTSTFVMTCLTAFLNKVTFQHDNVTFL